MDEVEKVFKQFDANGDGQISFTEFHSILKALGTQTSLEEAQTMMDDIDKDGNGFIDVKEFVNFHCSKQQKEDNGVRDSFELYDKNNDGLITARELQAVTKGLGDNCSIKDCHTIIRSFDLDGDGFINFEELKLMMA